MALTKESAITLINVKFAKGDAWSRAQFERCLRNVDGPETPALYREILRLEFGIPAKWIRETEEN